MYRISGLYLPATLLLLLGEAPTVSGDDAAQLARLLNEKTALEKRLAQIEAEIDSIKVGSSFQFLGMTLIDPTPALMKSSKVAEKHSGPIVLRAKETSSFWNRTTPTARCVFWLVEHPAKGFLLNEDTHPTLYPRTIREFCKAVVSSTVSPDEYREIWRLTGERCRKQAEAVKDNPAERERFLRIANAKIPEEARGKYVCRVVYHKPDEQGTMTTTIYMTKNDLKILKDFIGDTPEARR